MILWKSCDGVPDHLNPRRTPKPCAIAHENGQKWPNSRVLYDFVKIVWRVPDHLNPNRTPKPCAIPHENVQKSPKSRVFFMISNKSCDVVPDHLNPRRTPTPCAIAHENGRKWLKSRVLYVFVKIMWLGPGPFKSTSDPKTVCYSTRKRPEMPEITSFIWFNENPVTGPWPFKSTSDPKTVCYSPRKRPEMPEIKSFIWFRENRVTGSRTI